MSITVEDKLDSLADKYLADEERRADLLDAFKEKGELTPLEEQVRGLVALAAFGGNAKPAAARLKRMGLKITAAKLERWADEQPELYAKIADDYGDSLEEQMVIEYRELSIRAASLAHLALDEFESKAKFLSASEASKAARDLVHVSDAAAKDMLLISGRPTDNLDTRGPIEILRGLMARHPAVLRVANHETFEGEAQELPAEVESG